MLRRPLAARSVTAVLACLVVSGCGSQPPVPAEVQLSPTADAFYSEVEVIIAAINGTPEQRAQAEILQAQGEQGDYSACMRAAGFQYDVPIVNWIQVQRPGYEPSWWARPSMADAELGIGYAESHQPDPGVGETDGVTAYDQLSETEKAAYSEALNTCGQQVGAASGAAAAQMRKSLTLNGAFRDALYSAADTKTFAPMRATYATCMAKAGIPVSEPGKLYDFTEQAVVDIGRTRYEQAHDAEVRIGRVDVGCRALVADDVAVALRPALDTWVATKEAQVSEVVKGWAAFDK